MEKTSARADDAVESLSVFIFVIECYSESEQEDPEIAVEAPPPPHYAETRSPLVRTDVIGLLFVHQMRDRHSF